MAEQIHATLKAGRCPATPCLQPQRTSRICLTILIGLLTAACAGAASKPAAHAHSATPRPVPCYRQYRNWRNSAVRTALRTVNAGLASVRAAVLASDTAAIAPAMRPLAPAALTMAGNPMPRCADSRGIFANLVISVYRAAEQAHAAKTPAQLLHAARTLSRAATTIRQLSTEIIAAFGNTRCPHPPKTSQHVPQLPTC